MALGILITIIVIIGIGTINLFCEISDTNRQFKELESELRSSKEKDYRECKTCGVLVSKDKAHRVNMEHYRIYSRWSSTDNHNEYYCDRHAKPYDRLNRDVSPVQYYKDNVSVTEKGKIIK